MDEQTGQRLSEGGVDIGLPSNIDSLDRNWALVVLTSIYMLNLVDRQLLMILLQPIKDDLKLSDTELGLITGVAFGFLYATLGLPIGRAADRGNRATLASLAIGLWGLTAAACAWVTNFAGFFVARMAAAIGEAGCLPPTYSLVGDYFPESVERTRALTWFYLGNPLGALLTFIGGAWFAAKFGWRATFVVAGSMGLILSILVKLTVREPRERSLDKTINSTSKPSLAAVTRMLWRTHSSRHICIALIILFTVGQGLGPWYVAFLIRSHGMKLSELGLSLGLIFGVAGCGGVLAGGRFSTKWYPNNEPRQMRMIAVMIFGFTPLTILFLTLRNTITCLSALGISIALLNVFMGPVYAILQRLAPVDMRATTLAVVMLLANLISLALGPLFVGGMSDALMPIAGDDALRYAMLSLSILGIWAGYHFWEAGRTVSMDLRDELGLYSSDVPA